MNETPISSLGELPAEMLDSYASAVYANLQFLVRHRKPTNCRFLVGPEKPQQGVACVWKHPSPQLPLFAIFTTGILDTQMSVFQSLEPNRYRFVLPVVPDSDLVTTLAQELDFSEIHSNSVYSRESRCELEDGQTRMLELGDIAIVRRASLQLTKMLQLGTPVS